MNEQRKVIYQRRLQIIDGEDLKSFTEELLTGMVERVVAGNCPSDFAEEWDLEGLVVELTQYYPTRFTAEDLEDAVSIQQITESILTEALELYDERETTFPGGAEMARDIERSIMIQIIDQRWREHLVELDYLNEGIHLRGIAQTDPLVAWQREGFEMFGKLMDSIDDDYLRYVMHVQVLAEPAEEPDYAQASFVAAEEPVSDLGELAQGVVALPGGEVDPSPGAGQQGALAPNRANGAPAQAAAPEATTSRGGQQASATRAPRPTGGPIRADGRQASRRSTDQGRAERAVLVRKWSQVQGLPRRELNGHGSNPRRRPGRRAP